MRRINRILAFALAGLCASFASGAAGPVTLDEILSLLQAKVGDSVILRQVGASGIDFEVGVPEILRLKEAGAADTLIETLMRLSPVEPVAEGARERSADGDGRSHPFRIYKETTSDGQEVLHITNIDASGRRIGGEALLEDPAPRNRYEARGAEADESDYGREEAYGVIGEEAAQAPVVVNVYPPSPQPAPAYDGYVSPYMYRDPYSYLYPRGRLPGYYPGVAWLNRGVPSPPGSYSHFMRFHTHYGNGVLPGCSTGGHAPSAAPQATFLGPHYRAIGPASAQESLRRIRSGIGRSR